MKKGRKSSAKAAAKRTSRPRKTSSVEARAKKQGASGQRLSPAKTLLRNGLIVQRRLGEGWAWKDIAAEAGVTIKQCQRVVDNAEEERVQTNLLDRTPTEVIEQWLAGYNRSIGQFEALAAGADNTAAAVGAVKGANDARDKITVLLQAIGHVPHDLGRIKIARDLESIAKQMFDAVEAFRAGELDEEAVARVFYDAAGLPMPPKALPVGDG